MRLPDIARNGPFRWTLGAFAAFAAAILFGFVFVYLQTTRVMIDEIDALVTKEANLIADKGPSQRAEAVEERLRQDPARLKPSALFDAGGARLAGDIGSLPVGLPADGDVHDVSIERLDASGGPQPARATLRRLPDGQTLLIAWSPDGVSRASAIVGRGLAIGLVLALILGLGVGVALSVHALRRVEEVNTRVQRIIAGELRQRLPTRVGGDDPFDRLGAIVNGMLDEIEALIQSLAGVGDDIAHDLRTPLTRVRISLERARANAKTLAELQGAVDQAITGIDHAMSIITALLRIRAIEQTRRLQAFDEVRLDELVLEVGDLYEPIAEEKRIALAVRTEAEIKVRGDRDLLFEAVANLVDNAVKFTPEGGRVEIELSPLGGGVLRVSDTGPGVAAAERGLIVHRFYRAGATRRIDGLGIGLSLVAAIVKLHGFRFSIGPGPGFVAEIALQPALG